MFDAVDTMPAPTKNFEPSPAAATKSDSKRQQGFWRKAMKAFWSYSEDNAQADTSSFRGIL